MITLNSLAILYGGGPGSGCHGPACGRKPSKGVVLKQKLKKLGQKIDPLQKKLSENNKRLAELKLLRKQWKQLDDKVGLKKVDKERRVLKMENEDLKQKLDPLSSKHSQYQKQQTGVLIQKVAQKKSFAPYTGKVDVEAPNQIDVQAPKKSQVVKKFDTAEGHSITVIKPKDQYEKTGTSWLKKVSPQKGSFNKLLEQTTYDDNKEKTAFFAAPVEKDRNTVVQVIRNFGQLRTTVKEIDLIGDNHIARTRIVSFKNMGSASGFLNKRYGISFKFVK